MFGENTRRIRNRSASLVEEETHNLAADGPVISVSFRKGDDRNVRPSARASYVTFPREVTFFVVRLVSAGFK